MQKTSHNNRIALDKTRNTCYNTDMKNNNKNNTLTMKGSNMIHLHEIVASRLPAGELNELRLICEIGTILRDMGKTNVEVNFFMNVDSDFITDVLSCFRFEAERFASRTI
jgi:hypothetical protein